MTRKLPEPAHRGPDGTGSYFDSYTAAQMREYRNQALEEAAKVCDGVLGNNNVSEAIRALKEVQS